MPIKRWLAALLLLSLIIIGAVNLYRWQLPSKRTVPSVIPVTRAPFIEPAKPGEIVLHGQVRAAETRRLRAPVTGTVVAVTSAEGAPVARGELLGQIKPRRPEAAPAANTPPEPAASVPEPDVLRDLRAEVDTTAAAWEQAERKLQEFTVAKPEVLNAREEIEKLQRRSRALAVANSRASADYARESEKAGPNPEAAAARRLEELRQKREIVRRQNQIEYDDLQLQLARLQDLRGDIEDYEALRRDRDQHQARHAYLAGRLKELSARQARAQRQTADTPTDAVALPLPAGAVVSPEAGTLRDFRLRPGLTVRRGQEVGLVELAGGSRLVFPVPTDQTGELQVGLRLRVTPASGMAFDGRISQLAREDRQTLVYVLPLDEAPLPPPRTALVARLAP
jgi:biotin carboxyl carrier protein